MKLVDIASLNGRSIVRWVGTEMALSEGTPGEHRVLWDHPGVPYLQLISIDVQLDDGSVLRMLSQADDGSGYYGLYFVEQEAIDTPTIPECGSIYRTRELDELPMGAAALTVTDRDGPNVILRAEIVIGRHAISCWAAEVYERDGGFFEIFDRDESILIQIDGHRPSGICPRPSQDRVD